MDFIDHYVRILEERLHQIPFGPEPKSLYEPCRYTLENGGKRLRPVLTLISSGLCGGNPQEALPAALSVELIHNFTLVHDDIMDGADSRRGRPSVHIRWDMPTAILAGDMLFTEAFRQLSHYDAPGRDLSLSARLREILLDSIRQVCEGQALDLELEKAGETTLSRYLEMIEGKTAALIRGSLMMGGIVASAGEEQLRALDELGRTMGVAFQIQDDLLDVTADPKKFGKTRGGDILEGKKTWLYLDALEKSSASTKMELQEQILNPQKTTRDVERVISIFTEAGTIERAASKVQACYRRSDEILELFVDSSYKEDLINLLNFLKNRDF